MTDYAKINFDEIDPSPNADGFEGRFGRKHLGSRDLGVSRWRYGPGVRSPKAHHHREQEEVYVVLSGSGRALLGDETVELREGDALRVAPAVTRAFEAGDEGLELLAIGGPKPEGGDGEVVEAVWPE
ncbi:MAG TPA: cupin domain-containing protein [Solirubrobacterales bacterium]|nr:cupin domain-containing protein [Solirubrobacterales bacterium]